MKAVPAALSLFEKVQGMYYDMIFSNLRKEVQDKKGRRRAISNSIENAASDEDRRHLSIILHEFNAGIVPVNGHKPSSGETDPA